MTFYKWEWDPVSKDWRIYLDQQLITLESFIWRVTNEYKRRKGKLIKYRM